MEPSLNISQKSSTEKKSLLFYALMHKITKTHDTIRQKYSKNKLFYFVVRFIYTIFARTSYYLCKITT